MDSAADVPAFTRPDETPIVEIGPAADTMLAAPQGRRVRVRGWRTQGAQGTRTRQIYRRGQRMIAHQATADTRDGRAIGAGHGAESLMGFFRSSATAQRTCCRSRA
jgi:hypothetical protein